MVVGMLFIFFIFAFEFMLAENKTESFNLNFTAYVINLPKNTDRLKMISDQLKKIEVKFEIIKATNVTELRNYKDDEKSNSTILKIAEKDNDLKLDPEIKFDLNSKKLRDGELGCWLSHLKVLLLISRKNTTEPVLILEDDSTFIPKFMSDVKEILSTINDDWDYLRVGFCPENVVYACQNEMAQGKYKFCKVGKNLIFAGAHAYFVNGSKGAKTLFDSVNSVEGKIIDLEMKSESANQYTSRKKLVYQDQSFKSNSQNIPCI